ncbi:CBS domain-containing protein [Streptomyces hesseae]|uniref:CBS domain-containing protein n=1 Tax=Streptomyces hesseae TaxID=3075519 RepID=A0ABU2SKI8_9ACTN|nr:CBS domain-containing protein [Streptomyces sp. DSM 40473]MDT0449498.1 CBS domain-containing protein [Streptomyces sp. DSM 40473]
MHDKQSTVGDVMTQTVVAVSPTAPYKEIARTLAQWEVSAVPVLVGEGRVIGVVSEADLLSKEEDKGRGPADDPRPGRLGDLVKAGARTAEELMSSPAVTIRADAGLPEAARVMALRGVKRLPVVDAEGRLAGIVSRSDLLKIYLRTDDDIADEVRDQVVARLFSHRYPALEVRVAEGVVTLSGRLPDPALAPFVTRVVRAVEGVVNVELFLDGPMG